VEVEPTAEADAGQPPRQTRKKMSLLRQKIAERMVQAQQTAAILTTFNEADMTRVIELRTRFRERFKERYGVSLGFMSFFVKAVVDALKAVPQLNAQIQGDEIVTNHFYDIGIAVSTPFGLVVPVIRDADKLSFAQIEQAIRDFAGRARERKLTLKELTGGCFTISNGGVFGSLLSTPILNPPQSGILGLHAIKRRPVAVGDEIQIRPMMYLALSYDHRLVDGEQAVTFLRRIVEVIEDPERLMLEV
jgi:2-oxoglutarate dehydrogenase E2 component (dihydrolipoamide succinyltransferase)